MSSSALSPFAPSPLTDEEIEARNAHEDRLDLLQRIAQFHPEYSAFTDYSEEELVAMVAEAKDTFNIIADNLIG